MGLALLGINSGFADTVEHNGVTYETGSVVSDVKTTVRESYEVTTHIIDGARSMGYVQFDYTKELDADEVKTYNLSVVSFPKSFTLEGWSEGPSDKNYTNRQTNTTYTAEDGYTYTTDEFKTHAKVMKTLYSNLYHDYSAVSGLDESVLDSVKFIYHNKQYDWKKMQTMSSSKTSAYLYYYLMNRSWNDFEDCWDIGVGAIVIIDKLYVNYTEKPSYNTTTQYVYNTVATGVDWSGVSDITLGSTVTSVEDGAFSTATDLKSFSSNSTSFTTDSNGFLYTKGYEKVVAVPAYDTSGNTLSGTSTSQKEYTLNDNTIYAANNVLGNVKYVTLYSGIQIDGVTPGGTGNKIMSNGTQEMKCGTDNSFVFESSVIDYPNSASGSTVVVQRASGVLSKASLKKLLNDLSNVNMACLDLTGTKLNDGKTLTVKDTELGEITGLPDNCLLFLPNEVNATGNNVVITAKSGNNIIGGSCSNLVLTDKKTFYTPWQFGAEKVTYVGRSMSAGNYGTIILPFNITDETPVTAGDDSNAFNSTFRIANFYEYAPNATTGKYELKFQFGDALTANKPYLIKALKSFTGFVVNCPANGSITVSATPAKLEKTDIENVTFTGAYAKGYTKSSYDNAFAFGVSSSGTFGKVSGVATLNPFRSLFVINNTTSSSAKPVVRVFENADTEEGAEEIAVEGFDTTDIDAVNANSEVTVDVSAGKLIVSANDAKVSVVSATGAIHFSGIVSGQKSVDLPSGIYIVNGKKYIVK